MHIKALCSLAMFSALLGCGGGDDIELPSANGNATLEVSSSKSTVSVGEPLELILSINNMTSTSKTVSFSLNGPGGAATSSQTRFSGSCITKSLFIDQLIVKAEVVVPARTNGSCTFSFTKRFNEASEPEFVAFNLQDPKNIEFSQSLPSITVRY